MKRESLVPRQNWQSKCEDLGFTYHSIDGVYWDERACYQFSSDQIDVLESASKELHRLCLEAAGQVIKERWFDRLAIPEAFHDYLAFSWAKREPSLFGRFDLCYDGVNPPKLLEYNADTPTALLEASVVQWHWLEDVKPETDQFNSLHEKLIAQWQKLQGKLPHHVPVHFTCVREHEEDFGNLEYLRDTACQAGLDTRFLYIDEIAWADQEEAFFDPESEAIATLLKLYPWEWLMADPFGNHLPKSDLRIIEPPWKTILSNKGILPILWEMFPDHPNLLPAYFERYRLRGDYVQKPLLSREGANITLYRGSEVTRAEGTYGEEGYIYQSYTALPQFAGNYVVVGSWIIGDEPAGIGLREDDSPITKNTSRFIPHYFI